MPPEGLGDRVWDVAERGFDLKLSEEWAAKESEVGLLIAERLWLDVVLEECECAAQNFRFVVIYSRLAVSPLTTPENFWHRQKSPHLLPYHSLLLSFSCFSTLSIVPNS